MQVPLAVRSAPLAVLAALVLAALVLARPSSAQDEESPAAPACESPDRCIIELPDAAEQAPVRPVEPLPAAKLLFFWGEGCAHCERAKPFVESLRRRRPEVEIESVEMREDPAGRRRFFELMRAHRVAAPGIPAFVVGDWVHIGFVEGITEERVERQVVGTADVTRDPGEDPGRIETKLFGWIDASELGLPLFTVVLGLLDGFNPCAMWVLVFLLATLAGQGNRARMAVTAVTFVVVSGLMYFAFMAAWLGVFLAVGMTRPVQIVLGAIALAMGGVNLKDFFSWGRGPSLSIPAAAKPGIYARVRALMHEHTLLASLAGVAVLAVLVNFVELLCTAGLPAVYTAVLASRGISRSGQLAYIALYNVAYMLDDSLMVTVAVVTLNRRRLSEAAGRWLKLLSGAVMIVLGVLLVARPQWLP